MTDPTFDQVVLFTVGYQDLPSPAALVSQLQAAGVERLVDVRANASSRKRGFSKKGLWDALADAGIFYEHWPELGNPAEIRALYHSGDVPSGREAYRAHLRNGSAWALDALAQSLQDSRTCILCLEEDHRLCHRDVIAEELSGASVRIEHL